MLEEFSKWVEGKGYTTPEDFLKVGEFVRDRNKRRPRTIVSPETKDAVVEDVKAGLLKTHEIAEKYKITEASVYNIKSVRGLTKKRGTDTTTETTDTTETTETTDTTTETAEMTDTTEMTETTEMSPSPLAA
jgi:transposase-like protein